MSHERQLCTFHIGSFYAGMDVLKVREILRNQTLTVVPLSASSIVGLINLRGQIITAIDLRLRLGLSACDPDECVHLIVDTSKGIVSLVADRVGSVIRVDESIFEPPPETLRGSARDFTRGAYKMEEGLLLSLDPERLSDLS